MSANHTKKALPKVVYEKLETLKEIETFLGNLPTETWTMDALSKKMNEKKDSLQTNDLEKQTEVLFQEICHLLENDGMKAQEIAEIINGVLLYKQGPKYCNAAEVEQALKI